VSLDLEAVLGKHAPRPEVTLPVGAYFEACTPLVQRSIDAMTPLMTRADNEAAADFREVAGIYVVGGASELPIVSRALRERFGRRVHRSPYPSAAAAIGLAIAAAENNDFQLVDRYARTFAVFREADDGHEVVLDPIFTSETVTRDDMNPLPGGALAQLTRTYRAVHNVGHFRFFECASVDDRGKPRGDMALCGDVLFPFDPGLSSETENALAAVPVQRQSEGPQIVERYSVDGSGIVKVVIRNDDAGYERAYRLGERISGMAQAGAR
jgi:hypothetical protein